jgi:hypothetical protein
MKYSKGIMWLDDCRIPFVDEGDIQSAKPGSLNATGEFSMFGLKSGNELDTKGRFTPNLLVCDDMLNDGSMTKSGFNPKANIKQYRGGNFGGGKTNDNGIDYGDKGSNSRYYDLDLWFDKMLERL